MNSLDRILEQLQDTQWHSLDELKKRLSLPSDKLNEAISFLQKQAFIDEKNGRLRITCMGLRFSQL
ncbi:MAG: hypothetical protein OIN66_09140 [Candidatus Methanoperedens sp.]|nr:hypothetical protein [Candidatus Methanoperedens sp.]